MEKTIKIFKNFEEAEKAEIEYWQNASEEERINSLLYTQEMMLQFFYPNEKRMEKILTKRKLYDQEQN
jgi:hypothetical protein